MKNDGRFKKGISYSVATQFKKGEHWRSKQPHWENDWLYEKYHIEKMSTSEIASLCNCTDSNILFWMNKHGIKLRSISEARSIKHWGQFGENNPMFGRTGELSNNWQGGISPERQSLYSSVEWKNAVKEVFKRDNFACVNCGETHKGRKNPLHIHHLVSFRVKVLRCDIRNLIILCKSCHNWVHSKKNATNKYIITHEQFKQRFE